MTVSASGLKSFISGQKVASLALGLFILSSVWSFVGSVNTLLFQPVASSISRGLTEKLNIGDVNVLGIQSEGLLDSAIVLVVALTVAYLAGKLFKISPAKISVMAPLSTL